MAKRFMERRIPLDIEPKGVDVDPRPLAVEEIKKKAFIKV